MSTSTIPPRQSGPERSHTKAYIATAIGTVVMIVLGWLLLRGITDASSHPLTTLNPRGVQSQKIQDLVVKVFSVAGIVFVLVEGGVLYLIFRFRRRKDEVDGVDEPRQIHGANRLEWGWTIAPAIVLAVLAVFNVQTIWSLENDATSKPDMKVTVVGQQWWWEFRYDTNDDGKPDIITVGQMVVPVGKTIAVTIKSNDVIHSFWIPALNGKKDAVPGYAHTIAFHAKKTGIFEGQCTEFCGLSHGYMRMQVKSLSQSDFDTWEANQLKPSVEPTAGTSAAAGKELFFQKCAGCHQINGYSDLGKATDTTTPDPEYIGAAHPLLSGNAPNLTHLMSRERFAGAMFQLYSSYDKGAGPETASPSGTPNQGELGDWLRNPPNKKPMDPDGKRGMPNLKLSEDEISKLVDYLTTLK